MKTAISVCALLMFLLPSIIVAVYAHPGRTDGSGGHTDRSTGEYHYHHGYSAHDHYDMDGDGSADCLYDFHDNTEHSSGSDSKKESFIYVLFESLFESIGFSIMVSLTLFQVLLFLFGDNSGCSLFFIPFIVVFLLCFIYQLATQLL